MYVRRLKTELKLDVSNCNRTVESCISSVQEVRMYIYVYWNFLRQACVSFTKTITPKGPMYGYEYIYTYTLTIDSCFVLDWLGATYHGCQIC